MSYTSAKPHNGIGSEVSNAADSEWLDEVFHVLSNSRRRVVIKTLMEHEHISKSDLIYEVTKVEYNMTDDEVRGSDERQRINSSLCQTHLPKLEKCGIIKRDRDKIMVGERMDEFVEFMTIGREESETLREKVAAIF